MSYDFSYDSYAALLREFGRRGYGNASYTEEIAPRGGLLLRHDIDVDIFGCERLAAIETENGRSSTWFFQPNNDYYNPLSAQCMNILRGLSERHTLGLHIDPAMFASREELIRGLLELQSFYSGYFRLSNVFSFHRPAKFLPDPGFTVEGMINAYDERIMSRAVYVSDSNRRRFFEQERLSGALENGDSVILLTHPLWWKETSMEPDELLGFMERQTGQRICRSALRGNITLYGEI